MFTQLAEMYLTASRMEDTLARHSAEARRAAILKARADEDWRGSLCAMKLIREPASETVKTPVMRPSRHRAKIGAALVGAGAWLSRQGERLAPGDPCSG